MDNKSVKSLRSVASALQSVSTKRSARTRNSRRRSRRNRALNRQSFISAGLEPPRRVRERKKQPGVNGMKMQPLPVSYDFSTDITEPTFRITGSPSHTDYGVGCSIAHTAMICTAGTDGLVGAGLDYLIPFLKTSFYITGAANGFITANSNRLSGFLLHPAYLSERMLRETANWTWYRFKWVRVRYVPFLGTNTSGNFIMAFSRNPINFMESDGGSDEAPSQVRLSQVVPNCNGNLYSAKAIHVKSFPKEKLYPTDTIQDQNGSTWDNQSASLTSIVNCCAGRVGALIQAASPSTALSLCGQIWVDCEIEFYEPRAVNATVGTTFGTATASSTKSTFVGVKSKSARNTSLMSTSTTSLDVKTESKFTELSALPLSRKDLVQFARDLYWTDLSNVSYRKKIKSDIQNIIDLGGTRLDSVLCPQEWIRCVEDTSGDDEVYLRNIARIVNLVKEDLAKGKSVKDLPS